MNAALRRRPPIRDEIRHAAEHNEPAALTAEEVRTLNDEIEALEEGWTEKGTEQ